MSDNRETPAGFLGLLGVGMAVCCGLPLLLGAGIAIGAAGIALGSGLVIAAGVAAAVWGLRRRAARADDCCDVPEPTTGPVARDHSELGS